MRKQKIKKILSLLAAGVLLLMSMSGCGNKEDYEGIRLVFGYPGGGYGIQSECYV